LRREKMKKDIGIVGSQMDLGAVRKGVDMGPLAIRHSGLVGTLAAELILTCIGKTDYKLFGI
jgi:arginase family enzyme